jgi:hypothetical protein
MAITPFHESAIDAAMVAEAVAALLQPDCNKVCNNGDDHDEEAT